MDGQMALYLVRRALETALLLTAPVLVVTIAIGIGVALLQAVTTVRDMTLSLGLKLAGVAVTMLVCGGWTLEVAVDFTRDLFNIMQTMGR
jgi:flagellar biosynthetic protein FliQ